ncbi:ABCB1 [Symbiodinium sp. CCMP2592]|nr:ABCB1 [Symbiodinium sp. CCMP2592]
MSMGLGYLISSAGQFVAGITVAMIHGPRLTLSVCVKIGMSWGVLNFIFASLYAVTLYVGGHGLLTGATNKQGGDVVTVLISLITGMGGVNSFSGYLPTMTKALASAAALRLGRAGKEVMVAEAHDIEPEGFKAGELPQHLQTVQSLEFRSVSFSYPTNPEKRILDQLSFQVVKGQKVAFVGESGCGRRGDKQPFCQFCVSLRKSTTIQLLERFYDPDKGEILVNGVSLRSLPVRAWRRLIGYVGQEPVLFAASAMKNLKAGDGSITDEEGEAIEAARSAQILDTLTQLPKGLDTLVTGGNFSGGQKQRVAIARALARRPQILLLDEATSALDNESERMVQATLDSLDVTYGQTITTISIAHRLTSIVSSDAIYEGRVAEKGTHAELMALEGQYYAMASLQKGAPAIPAPPAPRRPVLKRQGSQVGGSSVSLSAALQRTSTSFVGAMAGDPIQNSFMAEAAHEPDEEIPVAPAVMPRLCHISRPFWTVLPFAFLIIIIEAVAAPFQALLFTDAMKSLLASYYEKSVAVMLFKLDRACFGLALLGIVMGGSVVIMNSIFTFLQESISLQLRKLAFGSVIRMHMAFFDSPENQTADLLVSLERHMIRVSQMFGVNLSNTVMAVLTAVVSVLVSFLGSWFLAAILLGVLPICGFLAMSVSVMAQKLSPGVEAAYAMSGASISEAVMSIRTVRALGAEEHTLDIVSGLLQVMSDYHKGAACKKAFAFGFSSGLVQLVYLVGFWLSAIMISSGKFNAEQVLLTLFCVTFGLQSVSMIAMYLPDSASGAVAAAEVFRLVDLQSNIDAVEPEGRIQSLGDGTIRFEDVVFYYPHRSEVIVLNRLSLEIRQGQRVAVVGFSGSGKSTVIQLLLRFYDPQRGRVSIGGQNLIQLDVAWFRRQVALVGQEPVLFNMSLEDNVKYGLPGASHEEVLSSARAANMDYALDGTKPWSHRVGLGGGKLSGGQKQRCAIARALLRQPKILLLDEATSALDSKSEVLVQQSIQQIQATTITVAHRLSTIRDSDKIFVLAEGRLVEQGTYAQLMAMQGSFAQLAGAELLRLLKDRSEALFPNEKEKDGKDFQVHARQRVAYGALDFAKTPVQLLISVHLLTFYQQAGASLGAIAFFTSTARCFDVLSDPLMAQISDGFSSRFGRRRPFVFAGCILYGGCLLALCTPPESLSGASTGVWFGCFYILFFLTDTLMSIPHNALGQEITSDTDQRRLVFMVAKIFQALGMIAAAALPVLLGTILSADCKLPAECHGTAAEDHCAALERRCDGIQSRQAMLATGLIFGGVAVASGFACVAVIRERKPVREGEDGLLQHRDPGDDQPTKLDGILPGFLAMLQNRPFRAMIAPWILDQTIVAMLSSLLPFYVQYVISPEVVCQVSSPPIPIASARCSSRMLLGIGLVCMLLAAIFSMPLWQRAAMGFGDYQTWLAFNFLNAITTILFIVGQTSTLAIVLTICFAILNGAPIGRA